MAITANFSCPAPRQPELTPQTPQTPQTPRSTRGGWRVAPLDDDAALALASAEMRRRRLQLTHSGLGVGSLSPEVMLSPTRSRRS